MASSGKMRKGSRKSRRSTGSGGSRGSRGSRRSIVQIAPRESRVTRDKPKKITTHTRKKKMELKLTGLTLGQRQEQGYKFLRKLEKLGIN